MTAVKSVVKSLVSLVSKKNGEIAEKNAENAKLREHLAEAVGALEYINKHSFGAAYGCDHVVCYECLHTYEKARDTLAKIKGE